VAGGVSPGLFADRFGIWMETGSGSGGRTQGILRSHAPRTETNLLLAAKMAFESISIIDCKVFFSAPNTLHK
jgi:hypothetical protein